jgi:NAD(P)-dependent dehydrogenase (short-subunit alcohol dehydrogenase family)
MMNASEKIAVVTGTSSGIGKAITKSLLTKGFKVYGIARTYADIQHSNFVPIEADLSNPASYQLIKNSITEDYIDILINDAGVAFETPALAFTEIDFKKMFGINFCAPILLTQTFKEKLRGFVINISSVSDRVIGENFALYCSSKSALNIYFDIIALEEKNIKFISLLPSYVDTPLLRTLQKNNPDFDWSATVQPADISLLINKIIDAPQDFFSGTHIIVATEALKEDFEYHENIWGYNTDTNELKKLNQHQGL